MEGKGDEGLIYEPKTRGEQLMHVIIEEMIGIMLNAIIQGTSQSKALVNLTQPATVII